MYMNAFYANLDNACYSEAVSHLRPVYFDRGYLDHLHTYPARNQFLSPSRDRRCGTPESLNQGREFDRRLRMTRDEEVINTPGLSLLTKIMFTSLEM